MNKFFYKYKNFLLISIELIILIFVFYKKASNLGYFYDEMGNLNAGLNFIKSLNYFSEGFDNYSPRLSSGVFVTLIPSLLLYLTNEVIYSRMIFASYNTLLFYYFKNTIEKHLNIKVSNISFFIALIFLINMSFANSYYYLVGEFPSVILFLISSILFQSNYRKSSYFLFGVSIFLGKFILLLSFMCFLMFYKLITKKKVFYQVQYFFIPPFIWLFLVLIKSDYNLIEYFFEYINFFNQGGGKPTFDLINSKRVDTAEFFNFTLYTKIKLLMPIIIISIFSLYKKIYNTVPLRIFKYLIWVNLLWYLLLSESTYYRYSLNFQILYLAVFLILISSYNDKSSNFYILFLSLFFVRTIYGILGIFILMIIVYFKEPSNNFEIKSYIFLFLVNADFLYNNFF